MEMLGSFTFQVQHTDIRAKSLLHAQEEILVATRGAWRKQVEELVFTSESVVHVRYERDDQQQRLTTQRVAYNAIFQLELGSSRKGVEAELSMNFVRSGAMRITPVFVKISFDKDAFQLAPTVFFAIFLLVTASTSGVDECVRARQDAKTVLKNAKPS